MDALFDMALPPMLLPLHHTTKNVAFQYVLSRNAYSKSKPAPGGISMSERSQKPALPALKLTSAITSLANEPACSLSAKETAFLSMLPVQPGAPPATIAAVKECLEGTQSL
jgi:hypothetical protein